MREEKSAYALSAQMNRDAAAEHLERAKNWQADGPHDRHLGYAQVHALLAVSHELGALRELLAEGQITVGSSAPYWDQRVAF